MIDSRTKNRGKLQRDLEANDGVDGRSDIPLITNENKYPDGLQFLPIHISLSNGGGSTHLQEGLMGDVPREQS